MATASTASRTTWSFIMLFGGAVMWIGVYVRQNMRSEVARPADWLQLLPPARPRPGTGPCINRPTHMGLASPWAWASCRFRTEALAATTLAAQTLLTQQTQLKYLHDSSHMAPPGICSCSARWNSAAATGCTPALAVKSAWTPKTQTQLNSSQRGGRSISFTTLALTRASRSISPFLT